MVRGRVNVSHGQNRYRRHQREFCRWAADSGEGFVITQVECCVNLNKKKCTRRTSNISYPYVFVVNKYLWGMNLKIHD